MNIDKHDLKGTNWKCPMCSEIQIISENGIKHSSKDNGFHWFSISLKELNDWKDFSKITKTDLYGKR